MTMQDWNAVREWRKQQRVELIGRRLAVDGGVRRGWNERMSAALESGFAPFAAMSVAFCWPFKGEFDPRFAIRRWREAGAVAALPVVVAPRTALEFRQWWPGAPLRRGVYDIPYPDGTGIVTPDAAIVPMNGFDERGYRLGYGGGFFDRTLAALPVKPIVVGVSFELARLATIYPQSHDIAMDFVVTEEGIHAVTEGKLVRVAPEACRGDVARLAAARGLPHPR